MAQVIFGVDVAKGWIDAQRRGGKPERIAMEEAALCGFAERAAREGAKVVFEATGGYDRPLAAALAAAGAAHFRVNPAQSRQFARAIGVAAKTDRVDAGMLEATLETVSPERMLWGADITMDTGWAKLRYLECLGLSSAQMDAIRAGNARRLFPKGAFDGGR